MFENRFRFHLRHSKKENQCGLHIMVNRFELKGKFLLKCIYEHLQCFENNIFTVSKSKFIKNMILLNFNQVLKKIGFLKMQRDNFGNFELN